MSLLDAAPFAGHAPVFSIDGTTEGVLARDLLRLDVEEGPLGLRTLRACFHPVAPDSDGSTAQLSYLDGEIIDFGREIECVLGPPGLERRVFKGTISAIEIDFAEGAPPHVTVHAEDALMRLRLTDRTASYTNSSDADLVDVIASEHGLSADCDLRDPIYPVVQQFEQSDLGFLRDRAMRRNAELWLDVADVIHLADRAARTGAEIDLVQGSELIAVSLRADLAHQRSTVTFRGWDDARVEPIVEEVTGDLVAGEVSGGRTGPDVVGDVFDGPAIVRARRDVISTASARAYAEAELRRRARSFVTVDGTTAGTPDLMPGAHLTLHRVGQPFEGEGYRVVHAHHSFDVVSGHRTGFRAERPTVNQR